MSSGSFKNVIHKMCLEIIYLQYIYKQDLALNNLQWLICYKTKQNQIGKAPFSITTTPRCRRRRYSFLWIAPLYP